MSCRALSIALAASAVGALACTDRDGAPTRAPSDAQLLPSASGDAGMAAWAAEFTRISVEARGERTVLERRGRTWRMVAPEDAPVDAFNVDALVSALRTGSVRQVVAERPTPAELKRFGLDAPRFVVKAEWTAADGAAELVLRGGAENPFDGSVYLQRGDEARVYSAPGAVRVSLDKTPYELRDKQVLAVPEDAVLRIEVRTPRTRFALRRDEKKWRVLAPFEDEAQPTEVNALFAALRGQRAVAFLEDSAEARKRAGVDAPQITGSFALSEGDPIRLALARDDAGKVFALRTRGEESALAELSGEAFAALERDPAKLRERSVLRFDAARVARVTLERAGAPRIVVERAASDGGAAQWRLLEPRQAPAKGFRMSQVLWALDALPASAIVEERPKDAASYGLHQPERTVTLIDSGGAVLGRLQVGSAAPGDEGLRYARGSRSAVVTIEEARLSQLPATAEDLAEGAAAGPDGGGG